jgi:phage tail tape-measure protein
MRPPKRHTVYTARNYCWPLLAVSIFCLTGCGQTEGDRASGGAATGAGTGAVIGLIGGPVGVAVGALIGAGVGAASGAAVPQNHLDLGKPPWSDQQH